MKLLIFFSTIFLIDFSLGLILKHYYFKQTNGPDYKTRYALENTQEDILIFGSSRAEWIFNPDIVEKRLGLTCYNAGRRAHPIIYHYALLKGILKRYTPKMVILSIDGANFVKDPHKNDEIKTLFPFYETHPEIRPLLEMKGPYEKLKFLSKTYPYNNLFLSILSGNSSFNKEKNKNIKGFAPLKGIFLDFEKNLDHKKQLAIDSVQLNLFKSFVNDCQQAKIELLLVCAPYNYMVSDSSITLAKEISVKKNIPFFDYSRDTFYINKPYLYSDFRHLNDKGAEIFTKDVVERIAALKK